MGMRFWQTLAFADLAPLEELAVTGRVEQTWPKGARPLAARASTAAHSPAGRRSRIFALSQLRACFTGSMRRTVDPPP